MREHPEREPLPLRSDATECSERLPSALHEVAELHPTGTRRLAAPALHAGFHRVHKVVAGLETLPLHGTHRRDSAPGG